MGKAIGEKCTGRGKDDDQREQRNQRYIGKKIIAEKIIAEQGRAVLTLFEWQMMNDGVRRRRRRYKILWQRDGGLMKESSYCYKKRRKHDGVELGTTHSHGDLLGLTAVQG